MSNAFGDDWFGFSVVCDPITDTELDEAITFDELVESTEVRLVARIEEDREGDARTTRQQTITGNGPVVFSSEVFSMHRLLWADGFMAVDKTDNGEETMAMGTFAAFKVNLESQTKSSGTGKNKAIQWATIQVEFHSIGEDADNVGTQRPVVVGWAPFTTAEQGNKTTAVKTSSLSMLAGIQAGATPTSGKIEGTASSTRVWNESYFDVNRSRPVSVLGSTGESSNYNGVRWNMAHNSLAGEGVIPELLLYVLVRRQDDCEYAVKITAKVDTARSFRQKEHKCILRVAPKEPISEKPAVCYLQGEKMWQKLDVNHFETLLSKTVDSSLTLPWDLEEMAGTRAAKGGEVAAAPNNTEGPENNNDGDQSQGDEGRNEVAAETDPNATLTAWPLANQGSDSFSAEAETARMAEGRDATDATRTKLSLAKDGPDCSTDGNIARVAKRRDATATPLDDSAAVIDALLGPLLSGGVDNMEDDLPTRMSMLETRMELLEDRMARQALLIRGLLKHRDPTL
ncbi:hypothetical protein CRV24_009548 [Beauveria bassiana]|nr:hypothetical protein CRV24_009548 [Beauveria bassiana]KAH8707815.1 hypothetical protein HC256_009985 [Beauveria bassiana]